MTFLKNKLLEQIKEGEIKLKPKWVFGFRILGLLIGAIMSILITIFFVSIVLFMVFYNSNTLQNRDLLTFRMVFTTLPWLIILLSIVFVIIFEFFAKKLLPLYRKPMIVSLLALGVIIAISGFGLNQNKAFKSLCSCGSKGVKPLAWIFDNQNNKYSNFVREGKVLEILNDKIRIDLNGEEIVISKNIFCAHCLSDLKVGDEVYISGIETNDGFRAIKGKKSDSSCKSCRLGNEIKSNDSCNNIWKGR